MNSIIQKINKVVDIVFKIFFVAAIILTVVTMCLVINGIKQKQNYVPVLGKIVEFEEKVSDSFDDLENSISLLPIIEYTAEGETYVFVGSFYSSNMKIGDSIDIMYSKNDFSKAIVTKGLFFGAIITGGLSILFLGIYLFYYTTKKKLII